MEVQNYDKDKKKRAKYFLVPIILSSIPIIYFLCILIYLFIAIIYSNINSVPMVGVDFSEFFISSLAVLMVFLPFTIAISLYCAFKHQKSYTGTSNVKRYLPLVLSILSQTPVFIVLLVLLRGNFLFGAKIILTGILNIFN